MNRIFAPSRFWTSMVLILFYLEDFTSFVLVVAKNAMENTLRISAAVL